MTPAAKKGPPKPRSSLVAANTLGLLENSAELLEVHVLGQAVLYHRFQSQVRLGEQDDL